MFGIFTNKQERHTVPLYIFNTLSNKKEVFESIQKKEVRMYNCGPTVYDYQHIGNLRSYVFADILRRVLEYNGYKVKQVVNITDVGHLTSNADRGEDKMEKGARQAGKSVQEIATEITKEFWNDLEKLNIKKEKILFPKATQHIAEQIAFIKTLEEKGYTYRIRDGVYFDTSLFRGYGALGNIDLEGLREGARVKENKEKKNSTDFALWKFSPRLRPGQARRQQEWESPWGVGFPGWHIECSAMAMKHLGKQLDIHTGGIDHIPIHHNNEIAQSESATGKPLSRYWLHHAFITIEGEKIAKSVGNTVYLKNIIDRDFSPLSYRYWLLTGHYKTPMNFTWEALEGAHTALFKMHRYLVEELGTEKGTVNKTYQKKFHTYINDDLDTPGAIALLWDLIKDTTIPHKNKRATILDFDRVLGLGFKESELPGTEKLLSTKEIPDNIKKLLDEREEARKKEDWARADQLRDEIQKQGYSIEDTDDKSVVRKSK